MSSGPGTDWAGRIWDVTFNPYNEKNNTSKNTLATSATSASMCWLPSVGTTPSVSAPAAQRRRAPRRHSENYDKDLFGTDYTLGLKPP